MTHENKFGMFVHWGIYSQLGLHEQALARYNIPHEEYVKLKDSFNPVNYDPEEWVLMAKAAGMKYICFTTKHHDGFCMWDTEQTDYRITAEDGDAEELDEAKFDDEDDIVSEELAEIYLNQGLYSEAIDTYRKLSLLNSEKSIYFAGLIAKIEEKLENK